VTRPGQPESPGSGWTPSLRIQTYDERISI
jgi:hypothetical protein